jgi:2-keto-4-pentenoate hydratase
MWGDVNAVLDLEAVARAVKRAQDTRGTLTPFTSQGELDLAAAYAVAQKVHRERLREGAIAVGRKIGFTNRNIWDQYGVHEPIWGYVYDRTLIHASAGHAHLALAPYVEPKIEPEIVFRFACAPPITRDPAQILRCIDWIAHGFEIVQSHYPGWKFQAADTIADSGLHGCLVVGEPRPLASLGAHVIEALQSFSIDLYCDDRLRDSGAGSNVLGSPLAALAHLNALLARQPQCEPIAQGDIITTGTLTAAHDIRAGQVWRTALRGLALPGLSLSVGG